eukprot:scaffold36404_cov23-Cyclotella_meneghiniana.AAC.2
MAFLRMGNGAPLDVMVIENALPLISVPVGFGYLAFRHAVSVHSVYGMAHNAFIPIITSNSRLQTFHMGWQSK